MVRSVTIAWTMGAILTAFGWISPVPFSPAWADRHRASGYLETDHFRVLGFSSKRHGPTRFRGFAIRGPRVLVMPGRGVSVSARPAGPAFEPPARFAYYCNEPPGYFPTVAACPGPWMETAAPSAP